MLPESEAMDPVINTHESCGLVVILCIPDPKPQFPSVRLIGCISNGKIVPHVTRRRGRPAHLPGRGI